MKKHACVVFLVSLWLSIAVVANAQQQDLRGGGEDYNYCPYCGSPLRGYGGGYGYGMGPGMMHGGYGMDPGRMGPGYGPGMMERGWGGHGYRQSEECQKYLNDTADLRRQLNAKQFEYSEAYRDPKTTPSQLSTLEEEIDGLRKQIAVKAPRGCW